MADYDTVVATVNRGAMPALAQKSGPIEVEIDLTAINSGALADGDLLQAFDLPVGTYIHAAGMEVIEAVVGAAQLVLDLGLSSLGASLFCDGSDAGSPYDIGSSGSQKAVGTYSQQADPITTTVVGKNGAVISTADTLDVKVQAITGAAATVTAGKIRVWAIITDVDGLSG